MEALSPEEKALCLTPLVTSSDAVQATTMDSLTNEAIPTSGSGSSTVSFNGSLSMSISDGSVGSQIDHEEALSRAVYLLMTARSRVLTLSEQKVCMHFFQSLAVLLIFR